MIKKYIVRLSSTERETLNELINKGKAAAYKRKHAQILLKADIGELKEEELKEEKLNTAKPSQGWTDIAISKAFDVTTKTVENLRKRLVLEGFNKAINRKHGSGGNNRKMKGEQEAHLVALTCNEAPDGYARWSLRLLADKMVELEYIDSVSHETIRRTLKKMK